MKTFFQVREANYDIKKAKSNKPYEIKGGEIHISKANFRKVHKDYKNTTRGKERMMALDPKTGGSASFKVVFTKEEVELEEKTKEYEVKIKVGSKTNSYNIMDTDELSAAQSVIHSIIARSKTGGSPGLDAIRKRYPDMKSLKKKGISVSIKEEVELDEAASVIDQVKQIASTKGAKKIGGVMVDAFTASAISQIYDKVNDANKKKMEKLPITKLADLAYKMMQRREGVELDEKGPKIDPAKMAAHMARNDKPKKMTSTQKSLASIRQKTESVELDEKKGALHLYDNEADARKKAKEVGGKVIKGTGKSTGKWAVKEQVELQEAEGGIKVPAGPDHDRKVKRIQSLAKQLGAKVTKVGKSTDGKLTTIHVKGPMKVVNDLLKLRTEAYEAKYNKDSVNQAIKKDSRIKGKEAKLIHSLLKGRDRVKTPGLAANPKKPAYIVRTK